MMAFLSSLFACFSSSRRISGEGDKVSKLQHSEAVVMEGKEEKMEKVKKEAKGAPIPMSYFPVGSRLSLL